MKLNFDTATFTSGMSCVYGICAISNILLSIYEQNQLLKTEQIADAATQIIFFLLFWIISSTITSIDKKIKES
jgi:uncharacterized protein YacL